MKFESDKLSKKFDDTVKCVEDKINDSKKMKENMNKLLNKLDEVKEKMNPVKDKVDNLAPIGSQVKEQLIEVEELQCAVADVSNLFNDAEMYGQEVLGLPNCSPLIEKCVQGKLSEVESPITDMTNTLGEREGVLKVKLQECGDIEEQMGDFLRRAKNIDLKVSEMAGNIPSMKPTGLTSTVDDLEVLIIIV